jgi:hypothetical protein
MQILAEIGVSSLIIKDKLECDAWRVYFQGRLTLPKFPSRLTAMQYLSALRGGQRVPDFVDGEGTERVS